MPEPVNILLVDDQPAKLLSYEVILQDPGQRLLKASSAREALEILLKNDVAVVLTDVCMPEFDGFELASMLREHPRYERTAVIFISAVHLSEMDLARGYQLGAVDYVSVPVVPEILRAKVSVFAELYRNSRELQCLNGQLEQRVHGRTLELEEANSRLRESEERLRLASEAAEFGTYDYNVAADSIHCSPRLKRLLETEIEGEMSLATFLDLVDPNDRLAVRNAMLGSNTASEIHELEFRSAAFEGRWLLNRGRSLHVTSTDRSVARTMGTILDITTRKRLEERQELLIAELDHRVKNVMANISAIARISGRQAQSVDGFVRSLDGRLQSMASAHSLLSQSEWSGADMHELAGSVLAPFHSPTGKNIVLDGGKLALSPKSAQDLALILHELVTNAVKHGALSCPEGKAHLTWSTDPVIGTSTICWRETAGPEVTEPDKQGVGMSIIQSAFSEGTATVTCDFARTGLVCTIQGAIGRAGLNSGNSGHSMSRLPHLSPISRDYDNPGPLRILLVEDEPLIALHLQTELELQGHTVLGPANSLAAGLELARNAEFDVGLLDVSLGRESSADIAVLLKSRGIPFAFATGYSGGRSVLPDHLHDRPQLAKPYLMEDVKRVIGRLAGRRATHFGLPK